MNKARLIQLIACCTLVATLGASGLLLPSILDASKLHTLRYTDHQIDNAPPEVVLGNAIGALRGIFVDVLWLRASIMKERGLHYEANSLASMITKLQPRFAAVWAFQGHNMAYNISVTTNTEAERWEWVKKGIDLVRLEGIKHNPNDIELYKELSFWFSHKIEGIADDAHIFYKTEFCKEWHNILGEPPFGYEERKAWIREIADAPITLADAVKVDPTVGELYERLKSNLAPFDQIYVFDLDLELLRAWSNWKSVNSSWYSTTFGTEARLREMAEQTENEDAMKIGGFYVALDSIASAPEYQQAWKSLLAHVRRKVLRNSYNMDATFMADLTDKWGPIDWRHASAHALYWARMGAKMGELRANNDDKIYKIINNDRNAAHGMQDLARFGDMSYDPSSNDVPSRLPDPRWINAVDKFFVDLYVKHKDVRGWGGDNFIAWHKNFMKDSVRQLYRMGDKDRAQQVLDRLDSLYGTGHVPPSPEYAVPLDIFVRNETFNEYDMQPHVATTDVQTALYYGIRAGLGRGDDDLYEDAKTFASQVHDYFRLNRYSDFVNKFGVERISGIIRALDVVEIDVFARILVDTSIPMQERLTIYNLHTPQDIQAEVYDYVRQQLAVQLNSGAGYKFSPEQLDGLLPPPPGLAAVRSRRAIEQQQIQNSEVAPAGVGG